MGGSDHFLSCLLLLPNDISNAYRTENSVEKFLRLFKCHNDTLDLTFFAVRTFAEARNLGTWTLFHRRHEKIQNFPTKMANGTLWVKVMCKKWSLCHCFHVVNLLMKMNCAWLKGQFIIEKSFLINYNLQVKMNSPWTWFSCVITP